VASGPFRGSQLATRSLQLDMQLLINIHHRFELWVPPSWFVDRLRHEFPQVEVMQARDPEEAERRLPDAEVLVAWSMKPEQFARARKLRWIHVSAAAVHALLIPEIVASQIVITNASSVHGPVVAEHAVALMMALARRLPSLGRYQAQRIWAQELLWRERPRPRELRGAVLGLVGVGAIGAEVARLALACNMQVRTVRRHPERGTNFLPAGVPEGCDIEVTGPSGLDEVLAQADFVVLAAPVTPDTRALIDATRLRQMKPDAYLINVGRGALVDEMALAEALREGRLGGAALDVFEHEPLAPDSPLWDLPGVLITPHSAGLTELVWERHYQLFSENLRRFLHGRELLGVVDKQRGY